MASDPEVTQETLDPVVNEAIKRFKRCAEWEANARERFIDDLKFAEGDSDNGYQWPYAIKRNRDVEKKPCLTMNIVRQHNLQIRNEAKKNKSSIRVRAIGNGATKKSADLIAALIRQIEYRSNAQAAYAHAAKFQVDAGIGWFRLATQYVSSDSFDQEIVILPVRDPLSVYMDPDCKCADQSDANFAFVFDLVPKAEFEDSYPDYVSEAPLQPLGVMAADSDWVVKDHVRVAEYFRRVKTPDVLVSFIDPLSGLRKSLKKSKMPPEVYAELKSSSMTKLRSVDDEKIEWKLIAGEKVVDETEWPGDYIPLIRMIGEEDILEGILDRKGHTRSMKDAQRMYNYNAALALDTKIPTPFGWTTMGQIQSGDWIFDHKGQPVQVKKALPVKIGEPCYKITFDTGYTITTDAGHIWKVEERGKRKAATFDWNNKTISTAELVAKKHFIHIAKSLNTEDRELLINPYLLGLWLGDGNSDTPTISSHIDDVEEEKQILRELGYTPGETRSVVGKGCCYTVHGVRSKFAELGLLGDKHIPVQYMRASRQQRLALLQGLMDSDGHFAKAVNQAVFVNNNPVIAKAVLELCASLSIKTTVDRQPGQAAIFPNGNLYLSKETYRIQFTADPDVPVFRLKRKFQAQTAGRKTHWRRTQRIGIKKIERVDSVPVRCLTLDTPEHLFLCGEGMIPTHNSAQVEFVALQSKTPYIAAAKAIENYEAMWNTANQQNHSVLIYNDVDEEYPDHEIAAPQRQQPPVSAPGFQEGMQTAFNQMMMTSGQWQNQMGMMGNERTGAAINARQAQSDTSVFHFQDHYADALRAAGKQIIQLVPKVYDTKRMMKLASEDGEDIDVELDPQAPQLLQEQMAEDGEVVRRVLNPTMGEYDVEADVGASYGTRREETVDALTLVLTQAPALTGIIGDLLLRAMDFKEAQEAAARMKRMIPPQALGKGPSPQEQQLQQQLAGSQAALTKALEKYAKDGLKLAGKAQMRDIDAYKAHTDRVKALADMLPEDPTVLHALLQELGSDTLGETLKPIVTANARALAEEPDDAAPGANSPAPGMPTGARQAPDGEWYITDPTKQGRYLRLAPLVQKHEPRGIVENA